MAGGCLPVGHDAQRTLTADGRFRRLAIGLTGLAGSLLLVSCTRESAQPTPATAPTLVVVTATPGPPASPTPGVEQSYVVREGDTLSAIAARFGVAEEAILKANGITDPNRLFVGQELVIPPGEP